MPRGDPKTSIKINTTKILKIITLNYNIQVIIKLNYFVVVSVRFVDLLFLFLFFVDFGYLQVKHCLPLNKVILANESSVLEY